jgi:sugar phosphate isomerase/epimerase
MKIGQRANGTSKTQLKKLAEVGFACVDYQDFIYVEKPIMQLSNEEFEAEMCAEREYIESLGLQVGQAHGPWRFPPQDSDANMRAEWLQYCKKAIWGTYLLGCKNMVIHPLMPTGRVDEDPVLTKQLNVEFLKALCAEGEKYGVTICLENMPFLEFSLATPQDILRFVRAVDDAHFKICLDTGHVAAFEGLSAADAVRELGNEIRAFHVHDSRPRLDLHQFPFFGVTNWKEFSRALHEIDYRGAMSLETEPPSSMPDDIHESMCIELARIAERIANHPELL